MLVLSKTVYRTGYQKLENNDITVYLLRERLWAAG